MGAGFDFGSWVTVMGVADNGQLQDEVAAAEPSIDEKTNKLVSKGRWVVPGYKVRCPALPDWAVWPRSANAPCRSGSATFRFYKQFRRRLSLMYCYYVVIVDREWGWHSSQVVEEIR